jgi:adenine/guanine phosphoribosyltransferase-like PRPP-binding protein
MGGGPRRRFHTEPTTEYWQALLDDWPDGAPPLPPFRRGYPVRLADGRVLVLPLRELPNGGRAVAGFIANQASFAVAAAIAAEMARRAAPARADIVIGMPTLGLALAPLVAANLGHARYVPFSTARKYWYDDALAETVPAVLGPGPVKRIYLDPNVRSLVAGRRVLLVDDVVSTGATAVAACRLLSRLDVTVASIAVAMKQSNRWAAALADLNPALPGRVVAAFGTPLFERAPGGWRPVAGTMPD